MNSFWRTVNESKWYRVSHETWQLVNGFECLLPSIILDIRLFQFISLTNSFTQIYFTLKSIFYKMTAMLYFLLFSFVSQNLTNYGRRHLKLFTNCHVSWDTLYIYVHFGNHLWFSMLLVIEDIFFRPLMISCPTNKIVSIKNENLRRKKK